MCSPATGKEARFCPCIDHVLTAAIVFNNELKAYLRGKESVITAGFPSD